MDSRRLITATIVVRFHNSIQLYFLIMFVLIFDYHIKIKLQPNIHNKLIFWATHRDFLYSLPAQFGPETIMNIIINLNNKKQHDNTIYKKKFKSVKQNHKKIVLKICNNVNANHCYRYVYVNVNADYRRSSPTRPQYNMYTSYSRKLLLGLGGLSPPNIL